MIDKSIAFFLGIFVAIGVVGVIILGLRALSGSPVPEFPAALQSWTAWLATVAGVIVSSRVLWAAALALHKMR